MTRLKSVVGCQHLFQIFASTEDERFHFGDGALHDVGDVVVGEVVEGVEDQGCALLGMEAADGLVELALLLVGDDGLLGIERGRRRVGEIGLVGEGDDAAVVLDFLADDVDSDAIDESAQFRLELETWEGIIEFDKDLLGQFLDIVFYPAHLEAEVGNDGLVFLHYFLIAIDIACQYVAYDLFFVHGRICY